MAMATATILGIGALLIAGSGTGYTIASGEKARGEAKDQAAAAQARQDAAIKEAKQKEFQDAEALATEEQAAQKKADAAVMSLSVKKKRTGVTSSTRSGTVLTSPLGIPGTSQDKSGKTLLGA